MTVCCMCLASVLSLRAVLWASAHTLLASSVICLGTLELTFVIKTVLPSKRIKHMYTLVAIFLIDVGIDHGHS